MGQGAEAGRRSMPLAVLLVAEMSGGEQCASTASLGAGRVCLDQGMRKVEGDRSGCATSLFVQCGAPSGSALPVRGLQAAPARPQPLLRGPLPQLPVNVLGDVVISLDTAARQAEERGYGRLDEARVLLVHGVLHLLGYDHEEGERAQPSADQHEAVLAGCGRHAAAGRR